MCTDKASAVLYPEPRLQLPECYPQPNSAGGPLKVLKTGKTPNGFKSSGRGWNTYGVQALQMDLQWYRRLLGQQVSTILKSLCKLSAAY